jgi:tRNA-dihydrouridine synthase
MYCPVPDGLKRIGEAVRAAEDVPLYGNGDIRTEADAARMIAETGCCGVAAARIFPADPLLIRRLNGIPDHRKINFPEEMRIIKAPESTVRAVERIIRYIQQ